MCKELTVAFYPYRMRAGSWSYDLNRVAVDQALKEQQRDLAKYGITLRVIEDDAFTMEVRGYADLLNSIRLRSPKDGISNLCLGHIIGPSQACDLIEDIRRGLKRVAFAPEMIQPEDENRRVCHNCGCGC